jgi:membrane fusion protein, copper/silver efflux system
MLLMTRISYSLLLSLLFYCLLIPVVDADTEATQYTCGMHPMVISADPGTCPICAMDLTPMVAGKASQSSRSIHVDPVTSQRMGIRTAKAAIRDLTRKIHTVGLVGYEEPGQHAINSKISGWVEKLYINETGQQVTKGDPLLELYSPDLVAAQEELLLAVRNRKEMKTSGFAEALTDADLLLSAARKRLQLWDIQSRQIKKLEKSGKVLKNLTLYAPTSGIVSRKQIREGEFVSAGKELLEISQITHLWLYADIYEYEIPWVKVGQQAQIKFPFSSDPISGQISTIYPYLEARTRTIKARIDLKNPGLALKPDMYAEVIIDTDPVANALCIPAEAVLYSGKRERVFVALEHGHFEPREVKVGLQDDEGFVEILDGLQAGDRVVTSAQFMLDSESKLREALRKMLEPETTTEEESLDDLFK